VRCCQSQLAVPDFKNKGFKMSHFSDRSHQANPPGYALVDVTFYREQRLSEIELLLPATSQTKTLIKKMKDDAVQAQMMQQFEAMKSDEEPVIAFSARKKPSKNSDDIDPVADRDEMHTRAQEDEISLSQTHRKVYQWDAPLSLIENNITPDNDIKIRNQSIFKILRNLGHMRRIARPAGELVFDALTVLRQRQPHFSAVVDLIWQHLRLAFAQNKPLHLPPILLTGEPGVGKTHVTQTLAAALQTPMHCHRFDSATTGSTLTGSERHWGNTSHGLMFELLCLGEIINPIIMLDEVDKACDTSHRNPAAPLHTLLEPISASHATDLSVGMTFDASFVTWVTAANDASRIPASMRSRFIEFFILPPLGQQAIEVAGYIAESVFLNFNLPGIERVPKSITKLLAHLTAREQIQMLNRAFASAFDEKRTCIALGDLPKQVFDDGTNNDAARLEKLYH